MADKFIFFCSWAEALSDFSPEDRCAVYDAIIAYVESNTLPQLPPVLQMAFKFIKKDIDVQQDKYEAKCEKRREAANKRWQKVQKITDDVNDANVSKCIQTIQTMQTMQMDNLHYNDKDNDKDNKININNCQSDNARTRTRVSDGGTEGGSLKEQIAQCKESPIWKNGIMAKFKLGSESAVDALLDEFAVDMVCKEVEVRQAKRLFISWLNDRQREIQDPAKNKESGLGIGEFRNNRGQRTYERSGKIVPESAPPRPTAGHYWNDITNQWENLL